MTSLPESIKDERIIRQLLKSKYIVDNDDYPVFTPVKLTANSSIDYSPLHTYQLLHPNSPDTSFDGTRSPKGSKRRHSKMISERLHSSVSRMDSNNTKVALDDQTLNLGRAIEDSKHIRTHHNIEAQMKHTLKEISLMKCCMPNNILKITAAKNPSGPAPVALDLEKRRPNTTPGKHRPLTTQSSRRQSTASTSKRRSTNPSTPSYYQRFFHAFRPSHNKMNSFDSRYVDSLNINDLLQHSMLDYNHNKPPRNQRAAHNLPKYVQKHHSLSISLIESNIKNMSSKESYEDLSTGRYTGLSPWRVDTTVTPSAAGSSQHFAFNTLKLRQVSGKRRSSNNSLSIMNSKLMKSGPRKMISLESKRARQFEEAKLLDSFQNNTMLQPQDTFQSSTTDKKYSTVSISLKPRNCKIS